MGAAGCSCRQHRSAVPRSIPPGLVALVRAYLHLFRPGWPAGSSHPRAPVRAAAHHWRSSVSHRSSHYWLWFLLFGIIGALVYYNNSKNHTLDGESIWLLVSGLLGLILGAKQLNEGKLAKPYDTIIGVIFAVAGILGILGGFDLNPISKVGLPANPFVSGSTFLGLALTGLSPLINTFLGLTSLNHGLSHK